MESPLAKALAQRYAPTVAAGFGAKSKLAAVLSPEEDYLHSLSPVDAHKFAVEAQNARTYTPEEAKSNLSQTMMDAAYVTPVLGNILSAKDAYTYGKDTLNATDDTERRKGALLTELSALGAITGLPFGNAASRAAKGAAARTNIFAGPMAKTADHAALGNAQRLESAGANRDEIWSQTGWFKGTDGKWRFEIDDSGASLAGVTPGTKAGMFGDKPDPSKGTFTGLSHPELEGAYGAPPGIHGQYAPDMELHGSYLADPAGHAPPYISMDAPNARSALSGGLHETQHHIQGIEGFGGGTNSNLLVMSGEGVPVDFQKKIDDMMAVHSTLPKGSAERSKIVDEIMRLEDEAAHAAYHRTAGEVEARNVQSRMNMTAAERRSQAPWLTQDVPDEQQIVRFR